MENTETAPPNEFRSLPQPWNIIFPLATRIVVWSLFAFILYLLRSFFLLVFLTFVFAYVQSSGIQYIQPYLKYRALSVVAVTALFLGTLAAVGIFVLPNVQQQAESFVRQFPVYLGKVDSLIQDLGNRYPALYKAVPELEKKMRDVKPGAAGPQEEGGKIDPARSPTAAFLQDLAGFGEKKEGYQNIDKALDIIRNISGGIAAVASAFLLALLFSFLILLDLPKLKAGVRDLHNTKIRFIFDEVVDNIRDFAQVLGQALEAQFFIAVINTLLTAAGIILLGLGKKVAFLSLIVFFSSFIPVVGVFISSIPICLMALQTSGGLQTMFLALLLIVAIHMIEGYVLNPSIYGTRMRINPVIVLIVLTISGKLFHFWGLILGVPVFTYLYGHAIRFRTEPERTE